MDRSRLTLLHLNGRVVDFQRGSLTDASGCVVTLRPQAAEVLRQLAARSGALVKKDELMQAVWPDIAVTDDSLVQCITEIRKALGDEERKFIKTVTKRGYVFEAGYPLPTAPASMPSVAVLPFDNLSGNPELGYFSDGVSEDVITMLSRSPDLTVPARNSSFVYKGKAVDARQVGKELGVEYLLEGSVRRAADKVRIVAQLIDARTGQHVWAERYDETGSDPWVLQDEVTAKIVSSLTGERGQVQRAEYRQAWGKDTAALAEYDYYLRGHELLMRFTPEHSLKAGEIWREGVAKFPESALLRVKLGSFHVTRAWHFWSNNAAEDYRLGAELIQQALSAPNVPPKAQQIGHWNLAIVRAAKNDFPRAEAEAQAAIDLAPYDANMLLDLASIPIMAGSPERALDWIAKAAARDPASKRIGYFLGWAYVTLGENEKAIASLKGDAPFPDEFLLMAIAHVRLDHMDEARAAVREALELNPQFTQAKWREGYFYSDPNILERQLADLGNAGLPEK